MANKSILGFGKDLDSLAQALGITGDENNELKIKSIEELVLYQKILLELKKFNIYLTLLNDEEISGIEVERQWNSD